MNTVRDGASSRYLSSLSKNISHQITNYQVVDVTNNDSVARGITVEFFESVTSEIAKIQVYLRQIMEHLSLPADIRPTGGNMEIKLVHPLRPPATYHKAQKSIE